VRHGLTNPQIAKLRGISVDAVKYHVANILQKLCLTNRSELRRWSGVSLASHLHGKETGIVPDLVLGPIGQIARTVKDITASRQWYEQTLGIPHLYSFGNLAFFDCGGVRLFLSEGDGGASDSIIYFRVDDVHSAYATLQGRGIEFVNAPHMIHRHDNGTEEWMAFFKDQEDRPLAIISQVPPAG
jgi:catechol 2,3-dioxygenase-like lactoylglutathione lyase family enzyme